MAQDPGGNYSIRYSVSPIDHVKLRVAQVAQVSIDTDFIPFAKIPLQILDG
jgi:hypothetical protein